MKAVTYFVEDIYADNYDPDFSMAVIARTKSLAPFIYEVPIFENHRGLKVVRMAGSPDAKLTLADLFEWKSFVLDEVIPHLQNQIDRLEHEMALPDVNMRAYLYLLESLRSNQQALHACVVKFFRILQAH